MPVTKRILPEATQAVYQNQPAVGRFHRALRRGDQYALEELIDYAHKHKAPAALASGGDPSSAVDFEALVLAMLLEQHKEIKRLQARAEKLLRLKAADP
jgi:hypothetical protein